MFTVSLHLIMIISSLNKLKLVFLSISSIHVVDIYDINPNLLLSIMKTSSGSLFYNKRFNLIEEMNITCQVDNPDPVDIPLSQFISILPSFPNLKYVSLSSIFSLRIIK